MGKLNKIPRKWEQLVKLKNFLSDCDGKYLRSPEDQLFYTSYLELVPRDIALEIIKRQMNNKAVCLIVNNFPYSKTLRYLPNVRHYCLWSLKGILKEKDIKKHVSKVVKNKDWFYTERKTNHKTVPEFWHCHVFVKEKKK